MMRTKDPSVSWPPPDPDRIPLPARPSFPDESHSPQTYGSAREEIEAFNRRKMQDLDRPKFYSNVQRRKRFHDRYEQGEDDESSDEQPSGLTYGDESDEGEESWRNAEGERLRDFGVDEDVEFYDEEEVPLAVLVQQRRQ